MLRKLLIIIIIALLGFMGYTIVVQGLDVLGLEIPSFNEIQTQSAELDSKIAQAEELSSVTLKEANDELNSSLTELVNERQKYEDLKIQAGSELFASNINKTYEMEFIWAKIGNYANDNKIDLKLDVSTSSSGIANAKNLMFTINGSYVGISDFIYDIEDDTELGFKIDEYKIMSDATKNNLQATFIVKDLSINVSDTISTPTPSSIETQIDIVE